MNKQFKKLLLKIAKLPLKDQKWILNQLTQIQTEQFTKWQGDLLLNKARRFSKIPVNEISQVKQATKLPEVCKKLSHKTPLFIAIILEQGQFEWENQFLLSCEQRDTIKKLTNDAVCFIKPATKKHVFNQWQNQLNFLEQLEYINA